MRFATTTLGCKVNQCDTRTLDKALISRGHEHVSFGEGCDLCVVNTCAVTAESVRKSRQSIRRIKKLEPTALIAVCGCYSQLEPDEVKSTGVDFISGTGDKEKLALELEQLVSARSRGTVFYPTDERSLARGAENCTPASRTRAFLKIQDGCDNYCAYCVIPYARGASRSEPPERIIAEAKSLKEQGYKEIVITGIEISSYGKDLADTSLMDIIEGISIAIPGIRLRIGSLDPSILSHELLTRFVKIPHICNHFHISLQSGCDATLSRMGRKYRVEEVESAIASLRNSFTDCAISADLITGFPGETDEEFEKTLDFIKKAKFSNMHIFPFSPRKRTEAADMPGQVAKQTRKERARIVSEIAEKNAIDYMNKQIGKIAEVLFEQQKNGYSLGHSTNYIEVGVKGKIEKNTICKVRLKGIKNGIMIGEVFSQEVG